MKLGPLQRHSDWKTVKENSLVYEASNIHLVEISNYLKKKKKKRKRSKILSFCEILKLLNINLKL